MQWMTCSPKHPAPSDSRGTEIPPGRWRWGAGARAMVCCNRGKAYNLTKAKSQSWSGASGCMRDWSTSVIMRSSRVINKCLASSQYARWQRGLEICGCSIKFSRSKFASAEIGSYGKIQRKLEPAHMYTVRCLGSHSIRHCTWLG